MNIRDKLNKKYIIISAAAAVLIISAVIFIIVYINNKNAEPKPGIEYSLQLNQDEYIFTSMDDVLTLSVSVTPKTGDSKIRFSSSNTEIIEVNGYGEVRPVKNGVAAANASVVINDKEYTASCTILVDVEDGEESDNVDVNIPPVEDEYQGPEVPAIPAPVIDSEGYLSSDNLIEYNLFNQDVVAWVYLPGTNINLPVAQNTEEMDYYLDRGLNRYPKYSGSAFFDYRSSIKSTNRIKNQQTIIYGHARGKDIFDQLEKKTILDSWYENPNNRFIYLNTLYEQSTWQIFACYYTDFGVKENELAVSTPDYALTFDQVREFYSDEELKKAMADGTYDELLKDSSKPLSNALSWRLRMVNNDPRYTPFYEKLSSRTYDGVVIMPKDKILTLSTCADSDSTVRYVVQAKLVQQKDRPLGQ